MTLAIPNLVTLRDGTTATVKAVTATVLDGGLARVVYTVEKQSGAWADVEREEVRSHADADGVIVAST